MRKLVASMMMLAAVVVAAAEQAKPDWLPEAMLDGAVEQLVERLESIEPRKPADRAALAESTRRQVQKVRARIDAWGEAGTLLRAPAFPEVTLPPSGQRHLDAMARYQLCNLVMISQLEGDLPLPAKRAGAIGVTIVTLPILRLRQPYLDQGGSNDQVRAFMTGAPMAKVFTAITTDAALMKQISGRCAPLIAELFEAYG